MFLSPPKPTPMPRFLYALLLLGLAAGCKPQPGPAIVTSDIGRFWEAYDQIVQTTDSAAQRHYLETLFLAQGSPGLDGMMRARNYTPDEYLDAIRRYSKFWASVRARTLEAADLDDELARGIAALQRTYPALRPAPIYFTIGALRSGGTIIDGMLLIGTELAMADSLTEASEFTGRLGHLPTFFQSNPRQHIVALNLHEYVHTQQRATVGYDLLSQSLYEGWQNSYRSSPWDSPRRHQPSPTARHTTMQCGQPSPRRCWHHGSTTGSGTAPTMPSASETWATMWAMRSQKNTTNALPTSDRPSRP
ncbi:MAG: hypothetical protein OHK0039_32450 [Bacteroidia bacterium]